MSKYLSDQQFNEIAECVSIYEIGSENLKDLSTYSFDTGKAVEYKTFLFNKAKPLNDLAISKTFVMIHNNTNELIGYFTLSTDTIKLTDSEKVESKLSEVSFMSLPAIKVGKLAINKKLSKEAQRKGYGSFALEMAMAKAYEVLKTGVACRFITVDADIEYDPKTVEFYEKNGFVRNQFRKPKSTDFTVSMRKDIFSD